MMNEDNAPYFKFTGPQRIERDLNTLVGLLEGVAADGMASHDELMILAEWVQRHQEQACRHPFNEIVPMLTAALSDGLLEDDEIQDLKWLCRRYKRDEPYYDAITADMQELHGFLSGIAADGKIDFDEVQQLSQWLANHENLKTCWPYDELESLCIQVAKDGVVDADENAILLAFLSEFLDTAEHKTIQKPLNAVSPTIKGVCAVAPEIIFNGRVFCFTGKSKRCTRSQLAVVVSRHGGAFWERVTQGVDYLLIGADGNPCWAFACYGRKVEAAIELRKKGSHILLVHEADFWDALPPQAE